MKRKIFFTALIVLIMGCNNIQQPQTTPIAVGSLVVQSEESVWSVYHPDPAHPWNRVFRSLYRRSTASGEEYGFEELDPLLWFDTTYLLDGPSHEQALHVLDEFLFAHAETLIREPLKRAMFQRDLWAVFDWLAWQTEPYPAQRQALETRLIKVIRRVALSREEIVSLPDNYAMEVEARTYPSAVSVESPDTAFLPPDLFQPNRAWIPLGREGGPVAMTHTEAFPFFGRSVFLIFVRSPAGREVTLNFIESLKRDADPVTASGTDVALVRQLLLIDDQGEIILSPIVETIQLRHFSPLQHFHEFELDRIQLLQGRGGLVLNTDFFMLFMSHGDVFESPDIPELRAGIPDICKACHFESASVFGTGNTDSIISYSRQPFSLPGNVRPVLFGTTIEDEAQTVIAWKRNHETWKTLETLWKQTNP